MLQNLVEKLELTDEKNLLIQGLPSSIEKQFFRLTFAKNVTPLLRIRKIDFALVFAINEKQLEGIVNEVLPALHASAKFWVAYPKKASKIVTTLNRDCSWECITGVGYEGELQVALDHVWTAIRFKKKEPATEKTRHIVNGLNNISRSDIEDRIKIATLPPDDFSKQLKRSKVASHFFDTLSTTNKKEYVSWIVGAKKETTRTRRLESAIDKLIAGKKNPAEK